MSFLAMDLAPEKLVKNLKILERDAVSFWNKKRTINGSKNDDGKFCYDLKETVARNRQMYYAYESFAMNDWQKSFEDENENQLFVGTESALAYYFSRYPTVDTMPSKALNVAVALASNLKKYLEAWGERNKILQCFRSVGREAYIAKMGTLQIGIGDNRDICVENVPIEELIVDPDCKKSDNPRFVIRKREWRYSKCLQELGDDVAEFLPDCKENDGVVRLKEVWFTCDDKKEAHAWIIQGDTLYGLEETAMSPTDAEDGNIIENATYAGEKPFVFFSILSTGRTLVSEKTPYEQAIPLQNKLNRRGSQITRNADRANSILVTKKGTLAKNEAGMLKTGATEAGRLLELKGTEGEPINSLYGEIQPYYLPNYVINDLLDTRNQIHNVLGTPSQFRGDTSNEAGTLGESQMILNQAAARQDAILKDLESGIDELYQKVTRLMASYDGELPTLTTMGVDGKLIEVSLSSSKIPTGVRVSIAHGSTEKEDERRKEDVSLSLAKQGLSDPYHLMKDLRLPDAEERVNALVNYQQDPASYLKGIAEKIIDSEADVDFAVAMGGEDVAPRSNADDRHMLAHNAHLLSQEFMDADAKGRQKFFIHLQTEIAQWEKRQAIIEASEGAVAPQVQSSGNTTDLNKYFMPPDAPPAPPQMTPAPQGQMPPQGAPMGTPPAPGTY